MRPGERMSNPGGHAVPPCLPTPIARLSAMVSPADVDEPRLMANASPQGYPARETRADVRSAYSSKIIKAGALLGDTRTLFALWDLDQLVAANLERFRRQNLLGKTSRKRADDVLAIFRQRYLDDESTARALAILTQAGLPNAVLDRISYFYAAQADHLLHDVVTDLLAVPARDAEVSVDEVQRFIQELTRNAAGRQLWSAETALRIAQGLLSTLRDFGILKGTARKRLEMPYLPLEAFAFVALVLSRREGRGGGLVQSAEWRLFLLQPADVERLFIEAQGHHLLTYHAAGSVVRVDFNLRENGVLVGDAGSPASAAGATRQVEEYACALAQRAR